MLQTMAMVIVLLLITACKPFSNTEVENQFTQKNKQLFFMGHKLGRWVGKEVPECQQCSFNLYTKKMLPGAMLFKQVNDGRGDLVFLAVSNIRYSFAVQTGGHSYSIVIKREGEKVRLNIGTQQVLFLRVNEKQKIMLGLTNYFIELKRISHEKESVDVVIWPKKSIERVAN